MVYWFNENYQPAACAAYFDSMTGAMALMATLREDPLVRFITMASESVDNVGKMGVGEVVDGKCPDGGDFLGRLSRYGVGLRRGRAGDL